MNSLYDFCRRGAHPCLVGVDLARTVRDRVKSALGAGAQGCPQSTSARRVIGVGRGSLEIRPRCGLLRKGCGLLGVAMMVAVLVLDGMATAAWAQETVTIPRSRLEALERRAAEAERLAAELEKARAEINRLKGQQEAARSATGAPATRSAAAEGRGAATGSAVPSAAVTAPVQPLPALRAGEEVLVTTLLEHFAANPSGAAERYARKEVRLRGVVTQVGKDLFTSSYRLIFRLPDESLRVVCSVSPPGELTKVYADTDDGKIYGEADRIQRRVLAQVGQEVVLTGRCGGLKDGNVVLNGCKLAGP